MTAHLGMVRPGSTLYIPFDTYAGSTGASVTLTGLLVSDIEIYRNGSVTQRASDTGYTLLDTDGIDFDGITGIHGFSIDLSSNATADFFTAGAFYWVVVSAITVDSQTVNFTAATFQIGYPDAVLNTTIATLSSQTSFTLTAGPAEDDALNGCIIVIHDIASSVQLGYALITDYTGSTRTVTLAAGTTFTAAAGDNFSCFKPALLPTVAGRTLDVSAGGEAGIDWANVGSQSTAVNLSATNIDVDQVVASVSGNVGGNVTGSVGTVNALAANVITAAATAADFTTEIQSGLATAAALAVVDGIVDDILVDTGTTIPGILGTPAGASISADIAVIEAQTDDIGVAGAGLTALGDTRLANLDATVSSRLASASYTSPPSAAAVADAVWDETLAGHLGAGSTGEALNAAGAAGDPWTTALPGAYGAGSAGNIIGNNLDAAVSTRLATAGYTAPDNASISTILSDTNDIQTRLPAALVSGRMDSSVGAMAANVITAAATAADYVTEVQSGLATSAALSTLSTTIGTPAGASVSADIAAIEAQTNDIGAGGAGLTAIPWNAAWDAEVQSEVVDGLTAYGASTFAGGAVASVTGNVGGNVAGSVGSVTAPVTVGTNNDKTGYALTSGERTSIATALLTLDLSTVTGEAARSVLNALRFLRNKWSLSGATLTVTKEDDTTTAWTAAVTTDASADPVTGSDPT